VSDPPLAESAEELFESAPCGYLTTRLDGTILRVNRTFEELTGLQRDALVERRRYQDLLAPGSRIHHETHFAPLLHMQGAVREIAVELLKADGSRLPALVNAVVRGDGEARYVRTTVFDATDRRRYERELVQSRRRADEIAAELQRSLLTGALPNDDRVRTEVVYRPGTRGLDVGGDWYDAFWLARPSCVGVVLGDVVGRGIGAAATMGQLRSAIRALAATGLGPAALLEALDGYARRHDVGQMATIVVASIDVDARRLRFACAGHPPPALVPADGPPRLLWEGRSQPLDAFGVGTRDEATVELEPGSAFVLYSDGVVERRDRIIDAGLEELLAVLHRRRELGLPAVVDELVGRGGEHDDVCAVAVHVA
jgi:phosphoserine phosphatase RsbU/P